MDVFTRKLFLFPLKNKKGPTVEAAFQHIFAENEPPLYIMSDLGRGLNIT